MLPEQRAAAKAERQVAALASQPARQAAARAERKAERQTIALASQPARKAAARAERKIEAARPQYMSIGYGREFASPPPPRLVNGPSGAMLQQRQPPPTLAPDVVPQQLAAPQPQLAAPQYGAPQDFTIKPPQSIVPGQEYLDAIPPKLVDGVYGATLQPRVQPPATPSVSQQPYGAPQPQYGAPQPYYGQQSASPLPPQLVDGQFGATLQPRAPLDTTGQGMPATPEPPQQFGSQTPTQTTSGAPASTNFSQPAQTKTAAVGVY